MRIWWIGWICTADERLNMIRVPWCPPGLFCPSPDAVFTQAAISGWNEHAQHEQYTTCNREASQCAARKQWLDNIESRLKRGTFTRELNFAPLRASEQYIAAFRASELVISIERRPSNVMPASRTLMPLHQHPPRRPASEQRINHHRHQHQQQPRDAPSEIRVVPLIARDMVLNLDLRERVLKPLGDFNNGQSDQPPTCDQHPHDAADRPTQKPPAQPRRIKQPITKRHFNASKGVDARQQHGPAEALKHAAFFARAPKS